MLNILRQGSGGRRTVSFKSLFFNRLNLDFCILNASESVYLFDASIYIFRAWFGYPDRYFDSRGRPVNAVYGYLQNLLPRLLQLKPHYMVAAFDESLFSGFRHQLYPPYKANRALADDALSYQLKLCQQLTAELGVHCLVDPLYEADDLLALSAKVARQAKYPLVVVSRDKDLMQLIGPTDSFWDWSSERILSYQGVCDHWGGAPAMIPDILALAGDSADNIPGVKGVGLVSAKKLIAHFGSLDALYSRMDEVEGLSLRGAARIVERLENSMADAFLFRELVRLHPPDDRLTIKQFRIKKPDLTAFLELLDDLGLGNGFVELLQPYRHE